jgi:hypothetical protein
MKVKISCGPEYDSKYDWNCFCQGGSNGIVLPSGSIDKIFGSDPIKGLSEGIANKESYTTAFFEAFPKEPSCFLRGEGKTIEDAEESCWIKYQKVLNCNHEMERRDRTDGYGYCKHCSYSSMVFEPLTKCCKCNKPTAFSKDYKDKYYCEKHNQSKPKNPNPSKWEPKFDNRVPRKRKKMLKKCAKWKFEKDGVFGKVTFSYKFSKKFTCGKYQYNIMFHRQEISLINEYKNNLTKK